MVSQVIKDTFLSIYKDDYRDSDNYHQILFNNRKPIQQRELNQMQTILSKGTEAIGKFLFKPGAPVFGGTQSIVSKAQYVKLNTVSPYGMPTAVADYTAYEGEIFVEATSNIKVRIEKVIPAVDTDPATLIVTYVDNGSATGTANIITLTPGRVITGETSGKNFKIQTTNTITNPALGFACLARVSSGKFFVEGQYVYFPGDNIVISKYTPDPDDKLGFVVSETIVTADDDENLFDNSGANLNRAASGADRYKIAISLALESEVDSADNFVKLCEIVEGQITIATTKDNSLAGLGDILAKRTYEESGDYMLAPMKVNFTTNDSDEDNLNIEINKGIAYVKGYRYENNGIQKFIITKPRDTQIKQNDYSVASYGNYVIIETLLGIPDITSYGKVNLRNNATYASGSTIGTARVRAIEEDGAYYRFYLIDVVMNSGQNFGSVKSIGTSSTNNGTVLLESTGVAALKDQTNNNAFFDISRTRPKTFSDITLTKQILVTDTSDAGGGLTIYPSSGHVFDDATSWIVTNTSTGAVLTPTISNGGSSATFTGLPNSTGVTIATYQQKSVGKVISKTLTTVTSESKTPESNGDVKLGKTDIYQLISVVDATTSNDITSNYTLDNGQRDNFYDAGKLIKKQGTFTPAGNVNVTFKYFAHGATGDFFAADSYTGQIDYADIPNFRQKNGDVIQLRDVLDFRSVKNTSGSGFTSTGAKVIRLPRNTDLINFDTEYYLPKTVIVFLKGSSAYAPSAAIKVGRSGHVLDWPEVGKDGMVIARVILNPYMINDEDLQIEYIKHKRYTMKDIGKIEERMDKIEELTSLSMLELQTNTIDVLDENGLNRFKSGITADNFLDHGQSATDAEDYRASIDTYLHQLRPSHDTTAIDLVYDESLSSNVVLKGDNIYITHTDTLWKSQPGASRLIAVNEIPISSMVGQWQASPKSDSWYDTKALPKIIIPGTDKVSVNGSTNYRDWDTNWEGLNAADRAKLLAGGTLSSTSSYDTYATNNQGTKYKASTTTTTSTIGLSGSHIVKSSTGDVEMGRYSIPYMRSRFVSFSITGLRPNTQHFFFFNEVNVSNWCNTAAGTAEYTPVAALARDSVYRLKGTHWSTQTQYPSKLGGPTSPHITDSNGAISGYFLIPNNSTIKFPTGTLSFKCTDVTDPKIGGNGNATSYAVTYFTADGILIETQETETRTRVYDVTVASSSKTKTYSAPNEGDHDHDRNHDGTANNDGDPATGEFR